MPMPMPYAAHAHAIAAHAFAHAHAHVRGCIGHALAEAHVRGYIGCCRNALASTGHRTVPAGASQWHCVRLRDKGRNRYRGLDWHRYRDRRRSQCRPNEWDRDCLRDNDCPRDCHCRNITYGYRYGHLYCTCRRHTYRHRAGNRDIARNGRYTILRVAISYGSATRAASSSEPIIPQSHTEQMRVNLLIW